MKDKLTKKKPVEMVLAKKKLIRRRTEKDKQKRENKGR